MEKSVPHLQIPSANVGPTRAEPLDGLIADLEHSLTALVEAHEALPAVIEDERRSLVELRVDRIHACARRKAEIAMEIRDAEEQRLRATQLLGARLGLIGEAVDSPVRLTRVIEALPEDRRTGLSDLRERLREALGAVGEGQRLNGALAERFLGVLQRSMQAVQETVAALPLYSSTAQVGQANWRGSLVHQTA